jgi:hypothetical protein
MPRFSISLPSGETLPDDFARELVSLLGFTAPDGSNHADDARTHGTALADAYSRLDEAGREAFVTLASELLSEWESRLGVVSAAQSTDAQRRAALVSVRRAGGANNRAAFLSALQAIDPTASIHTGSVLENTSYPRGVFVLSVRLAPSVLANSAQRARIEDVLSRMAPAYVVWHLASNEGFFYDDPGSLFDTPGDVLSE